MAPVVIPTSTVWLVFAAKAVRTFCYGYLGILIPLHLAALGLGAGGIGVAVTLTLGASALLTLLIRRPAERHGGRAVLVAARVPRQGGGHPPRDGAQARPGRAGRDARQRGGQHRGDGAVPVDRAGAGGAGRCRAGPHAPDEPLQPRRLRRRRGWAPSPSPRCPAAGAWWARGLSARRVRPALLAVRALGRPPGAPLRAAAGHPRAAARGRRPALPLAPLVYRIAALFALDSFAGGFVLQSLLVYWLYTHFALTPAAIGAVFCAAQLLTACSVLLAGRASPRFGLVNTMVFSHLVSNACSSRWGSRRRPGWR